MHNHSLISPLTCFLSSKIIQRHIHSFLDAQKNCSILCWYFYSAIFHILCWYFYSAILHVLGYKWCVFFFETNQAGELPIILKRRNNTQTGHHNNQQDTTTGQTTIQLLSNSTQTTTGWIGTSTRLHNSTRLHTPLLRQITHHHHVH